MRLNYEEKFQIGTLAILGFYSPLFVGTITLDD